MISNRIEFKDDIDFLNEKIRESKKCIINLKILYYFAKLFKKDIFDDIGNKYIKIINDVKYELDVISFVKKFIINNIVIDEDYSKLEKIIQKLAEKELLIVKEIKDLTALVSSYSSGYTYYNFRKDNQDDCKVEINELIKNLKSN